MRRQRRPAAEVVALLALLATCGGPPPPATPEPIPVDAGVDAAPDAPPDPATAELLVAITGFRDRACACADAACAGEVEVAQVQWAFANRPLLDRSRPTPAQDRALRDVVEAYEACVERFEPHGI
jgi:hypothetical protein